jgi:large subunit ribosomal protein L3
MKFILGKKEEMSQIFDENGKVLPVTVVNAGPVVVIDVKTMEKDGYDSILVGYGERKSKNINKAQKGQFKELGNFEKIKEFRMDISGINIGDNVDISSFEEGDNITVSGISKGKGFQGGVKRHGFHGGRRSHGQKHSEREVGSIGATGPQRVFKGTRMGGRMGTDRVTVKNLKVVAIDKENNKLLISGAVPGRRGTFLEIRG